MLIGNVPGSKDIVSTTIERITQLQSLYSFSWKELMVDVPELVLGSAAIALLALPRTGGEDEGMKLLQVFGDFVDKQKRSIRAMGRIASARKKEKYIMVQTAMESIVQSLQDLLENPLLEDSIDTLLSKIGDLCEGQPAFKTTEDILRPLLRRRGAHDRRNASNSIGKLHQDVPDETISSASADYFHSRRIDTSADDIPLSPGSTAVNSPRPDGVRAFGVIRLLNDAYRTIPPYSYRVFTSNKRASNYYPTSVCSNFCEQLVVFNLVKVMIF